VAPTVRAVSDEARKEAKMGQLDGALVDANANVMLMAGAGTRKQEVAPTVRAVSDEERTALEARKEAKTGQFGGPPVKATTHVNKLASVETLEEGPGLNELNEHRPASAAKRRRRKRHRAKTKKAVMSAAPRDALGGDIAGGLAAGLRVGSDGISGGGLRMAGPSLVMGILSYPRVFKVPSSAAVDHTEPAFCSRCFRDRGGGVLCFCEMAAAAMSKHKLDEFPLCVCPGSMCECERSILKAVAAAEQQRSLARSDAVAALEVQETAWTAVDGTRAVAKRGGRVGAATVLVEAEEDYAAATRADQGALDELAPAERAEQVAVDASVAERAVVADSAREQQAEATNSVLVWFDRGRMLLRGAAGSGRGLATLFDGAVTGLDSATCCILVQTMRNYFDSVEVTADGRVRAVRSRRADGFVEDTLWLDESNFYELMFWGYRERREEDGNVTWY